MRKIQIASLLLLLSIAVSAAAKEAYFFVWSSCQQCCESGEGHHLYVSNVIYGSESDWDNLEGPFIGQVKAEYPNGAGGATLSSAYASDSDATEAREKMIDGMRSYSQIHEIRW